MKRVITALMLLTFASGTGVAYAEEGDWDALHNETLRLNREKDFDSATVVALRALEVAQKAAEHHDKRVAVSLHDLGLLYQHLGQYAESESFYRRALALLMQYASPDDPNTLRCRQHLASLYRQMGREADAVAVENRTAVIPPVAMADRAPPVAAATPAAASSPSAVAPQGQALTWIPWADVPKASPATPSGETSIVFINHLATEVALHWLDVDGISKEYGVIQPGASSLQRTHVGHIWTISTGGSLLGVVAAAQAPGTIDISEHSLTILEHGQNAGTPILYAASRASHTFLEGCLMERSQASVDKEEYGVVNLQFVVDTTGKMTAYKILQSSGYKNLDLSAVASLNRCTFNVEKRDGVPVYTTHRMSVTYKQQAYLN